MEPSYHADSKTSETPIFGCAHYQKKCFVRSSKCATSVLLPNGSQRSPCKDWYGCRLCHDEARYDHEIDRQQLDEMLCMPCLAQAESPDQVEAQPLSQECSTCHETMGAYYCDVCKFFDDSGRSLYHCKDCGICRVGVREEYTHCLKCNCCLRVSIDHECLDNVLDNNCAVCAENLFTSTTPLAFLPCGHAMHQDCYKQLLQNNINACPTCRKTLIKSSSLDEQIENYLAINVMPDEFKYLRAEILCNDCVQKCTVKFHFAYNRCTHCDSFNTVVERKWEDKPDEDVTENKAAIAAPNNVNEEDVDAVAVAENVIVAVEEVPPVVAVVADALVPAEEQIPAEPAQHPDADMGMD